MNDEELAERFPPGEYIKEMLEDRDWTQNDLAEILGRPLQLVNEVILGKRGITPETARGLAEAFGTSAQLWLNLDSAWQLYKAKDGSTDPGISLRARIYSKAPIKEMVKRGWLEFSSDPEVLEKRVLSALFLEASLDEVPTILPAAARMSTSYDSYNPSQWAWLCQAFRIGPHIPVMGQFKPSEQASLLTKLRALMAHPEDVKRVPQILAEAGIRFLVLEHLSKSKIDGACLWLDANSPLLVLSMRYDRIDWFWFTLMHEVKHAFAGDGKGEALALDIDLVGESRREDAEKPAFEVQADRFAEESLVPGKALDDFILRKAPLISAQDILGFAYLNQVHPGLVVGQLHHRLRNFSKFRQHLAKVRDILTSTSMTDGWGHQVPV